MKPILQTTIGNFDILWDKSSTIYKQINEYQSLEGKAHNIPGEIFFYQYELDIPFDGTEREVFEKSDVVYWRSQKEKGKFGILFMYANTTYGTGTAPQTSSPGIKIGTIKHYSELENIISGTLLKI